MSTVLEPQTKSPLSQEKLSLASEQYLKPATNLGDAILHLTVSKTEKSEPHFVVEIYDEVEEQYFDVQLNKQQTRKVCAPPRSRQAATFVTDRFLHGHKQISRKGALHPIYQIPITDYSISLLNKAWPNKKIISEVAKPFMQRIFLREFKAQLNANRTANWKNSGAVPTDKWFDEHDKYLALKDIVLNAYQKVASYNACFSKSYCLFCDPGTGKTAMMIRKLDYVVDHSERETMTLILCPKNIRTNWINEIKKFSTNSNKFFIVQLQGNDPTNRAVNFINALATEEAQGKHIILISGYESFVQTPKLHDSESPYRLEFDLCLLDESHNIANPGTKRTKTLLGIRDCFANVVIATGTPFRNSPFDIYSQLEFLGEGFSGFESFNAFKNFYGEYSAPSFYNGMRKLVNFQNIPLLQEKMAKYAFIIRKEEALPYLPKKSFSIAECNLTKDQLRVYLELANQLCSQIESYGPEPDSITVNNILTQMLRLAQITSGFSVLDTGTILTFEPNPKLNLLVELLKGNTDEDDGEDGVLTDPNNKAIVWCAFKENLRIIQNRLTTEGIKSVVFHGSIDNKDEVVDQFNCDRETRVFIGIAASGGVGLNLVGFDPYHANDYTTNTTDTFIYSSNWSMVNRLQSIDRAHRHNTRVPQHIRDLLVPNSIDHEIYSRLEAKTEMSLTMQDIKKILSCMVPNYNGN